MRTEHDLREALHAATDEPARADRVYAQVVARTRPRARDRRPVLVLAAAALVLVVLAGIVLGNRSREAGPVEPPTPALVDEGRVEGNWRMVHRVDPPPGWEVVLRSVSASTDTTMLQAPDAAFSCDVDAWRAGTRPTSPEPLDDVTIGGRPAYSNGPQTLQWYYRNDAVAQVTCTSGGLAQARTIAERVVFAPSGLRVPLRLGQVPEGYRVDYLAEQNRDDGPAAMLLLRPADADPAWLIAIVVARGGSTVTDLPSRSERETIAGYPALLDPLTGTLELETGPYMVSLQFAGGQQSDRWTPGRREQLVRLAESLALAPDLGDPNTWFDAEDAVPS
jgi:hypothetical protein